MRLDLGGIAKGYALASALDVLRRQGVPAAMIHAGGDSALGDPPPGRPGWRIGVGLLKPEAPPLELLTLSNTCVSSSGDMWQHVEIGGKRYSHVVDPHTGVGLVGQSNVVVIAPARGHLRRPVQGRGRARPTERGLALIDARPDARALMLRDAPGKLEIHRSRRWKAPQPAASKPAS